MYDVLHNVESLYACSAKCDVCVCHLTVLYTTDNASLLSVIFFCFRLSTEENHIRHTVDSRWKQDAEVYSHDALCLGHDLQ